MVVGEGRSCEASPYPDYAVKLEVRNADHQQILWYNCFHVLAGASAGVRL